MILQADTPPHPGTPGSVSSEGGVTITVPSNLQLQENHQQQALVNAHLLQQHQQQVCWSRHLFATFIPSNIIT